MGTRPGVGIRPAAVDQDTLRPVLDSRLAVVVGHSHQEVLVHSHQEVLDRSLQGEVDRSQGTPCFLMLLLILAELPDQAQYHAHRQRVPHPIGMNFCALLFF